MPIGNPVTLTSNVASKAISVTATASQTLFNVTGGYRINELGVFKNGLRLQDGVDYTARDGLTVTLLSAASGGDKLQFVVFDTFRVAEAIRPSVDEQTIRGNLNVVGILSCTDLEGPVSLNITSGIQTFHDVRVGGALTVAGTLTYEDTTNSNVTGLATFSGGMNISAIGATATTLNVTGVSTFGGIVSIGDSIFHTGDTNSAFGFPAADTFTVYTAGSERVRVTSAGRLGIGTPEPGRQLTLDHASQAEIGLLSGADTSGGLIYQNASEQKVLVANRESDGHISFETGGVNERLRITSAGNIGIKTDTPAAPLHVDSDNAYGSFVLSRDGGVSGRRPFGFGISGDTDANFRISASGDTLSENAFDNQIIDITAAGLVGIGTDAQGASSNTLLTLQATGSTACRLVLANTASSSRESTQIFSQNNDLAFQTNGSEVVRIDSNGNMGLGVSPSARLHVEEDLTHASTFYLNSDAHILVDNPSSEATAKAVLKLEGDAALVYGGGTNTLIISDRQNERMRIGVGGGVNISGITTATQLFEGTTRVATTGKAIAMAMLFG